MNNYQSNAKHAVVSGKSPSRLIKQSLVPLESGGVIYFTRNEVDALEAVELKDKEGWFARLLF